MRKTLCVLLAAVASGVPEAAAEEFDVVVVGAGIGGLTTALRATEQGLRVGVVDMASVYGGHALMSTGGLCIVGTPLQKEKGINDSPELAYGDFIRQGKDANEAMVKLYVERSRELIYDWMTGLGVKFNAVSPGGMGKTGNSVSRFHMNPKLGYGLVSPIYRECLRKGVTFHWNTRVTALTSKGGAVRGVRGNNLRTGKAVALDGQAVVLATGGFESNMELVRKHWPKHLGAVPERVMLGSGVNSTGSGLTLATSAGGTLHNMDHQWIYPRGIPDPMHLGEGRGLYAMVAGSIYLNRQGARFMDETSATTEAIRAVVAQPGGTYWMLFDADGANSVFAVGIDWQDRQKVRREIVENEALVKSGATLAEVAGKAGLPPEAVQASVERWNQSVGGGVDGEFKRPMRVVSPRGTFNLAKIEKGPFYLMQVYPLSRKSMGGIAVDLDSRVLKRDGKPVGGLYAVGEATGEGGLKGQSALEGTFLGPSIVQGHLAAAHLAATVRRSASRAYPAESTKPATAAGKALDADCGQCHRMDRLTVAKRPGYWHFEKLHTVVAARGFACKACHAEMSPYRPGAHQTNKVAQIDVCATCHLVRE